METNKGPIYRIVVSHTTLGPAKHTGHTICDLSARVVASTNLIQLGGRSVSASSPSSCRFDRRRICATICTIAPPRPPRHQPASQPATEPLSQLTRLIAHRHIHSTRAPAARSPSLICSQQTHSGARPASPSRPARWMGANATQRNATQPNPTQPNESLSRSVSRQPTPDGANGTPTSLVGPRPLNTFGYTKFQSCT